VSKVDGQKVDDDDNCSNCNSDLCHSDKYDCSNCNSAKCYSN
jgi:hypothetical protein